MDQKQRLRRAYHILEGYDVLDRISVVFGQYTPLNISEFVGHCLANSSWISNIKVFVDMDNTLFRFSYGKADDIAVLEKMFDEGFYENLEPMKNIGIYEAMMLMGMKVFILSACIPSPHCRQEKMASIEKYMPFIPKRNVILLPNGTSKVEHAKRHAHLDSIKDTFLIDDYKGNLKEWVANGGIAIKKAMSFKMRPYPTLLDHRDVVDMVLSLAKPT